MCNVCICFIYMNLGESFILFRLQYANMHYFPIVTIHYFPDGIDFTRLELLVKNLIIDSISMIVANMPCDRSISAETVTSLNDTPEWINSMLDITFLGNRCGLSDISV
ncbi:unnamed protein product [Musa textilis]